MGKGAIKICLIILSVICINACLLRDRKPHCNEDLYDKQYFYHDSDCSKYYLCEDGILYELQCNEGYEFYEDEMCQEYEICDGPTCTLKRINLSPRLEHTIPPCEEPPTCEGIAEGTTLAVPGNCSIYIYCDANGEEVYSNCSPGYAYDIDYMFCRNESVANCPECFFPTTTEQITTLGECDPTPLCYLEEFDIKKPYPPDCHYYVYCTGYENGTDGSLRICPPNYLFNTTISQCMLENETSCLYCNLPTTTEVSSTIYYCPEIEPCVAGVNDYTFLPVPQNCSFFIFCDPIQVSGYQLRKCAQGYYFDQILGRCVNATIAYCPDCILTTEIDITSLSPYPPCAAQETCLSLGNGTLIPYPPDCKKYFYCDDGIGDMMSCAAEQHFSPINRTCLPIEDANCPLCSP